MFELISPTPHTAEAQNELKFFLRLCVSSAVLRCHRY